MSDDTMLAPSPPKPVAPVPAPKEPTIKDRASGLLAAMTDAQRHNAPITPWMLTELAAVVGKVTGDKPAVVPHVVRDARGLPDQVVFKKQDGGIEVVTSVEEALAYVRSLPKDVQDRPHWKVVDKQLVDATGQVQDSDVSPAIRQFKWAVSEDERLNPRPVPEIKDKPGAKEDAKKSDTNMESQRQAQSIGTADASMPGEPGPGGVRV